MLVTPESLKGIGYHACSTKAEGSADMQWDLFWDVDVALPYKQMWKGKEVANNMIFSSLVASYDLLLWYAEKV